MYSDDKLIERLKQLNIVEEETLLKVYESCKHTGESFYQALIRQEIISDKDLGFTVADILNYPFIRLDEISIAPEVANIIPSRVAKEHNIIPFDVKRGILKIATDNPKNIQLIENIRKKTNSKIKVYYATQKDLQDALKVYSKGLKNEYQEILSESIKKTSKSEQDDISVTKVVDALVNYAYEEKASDVHIEPADASASVRFRVDGVLKDVLDVPMAVHHRLVNKVKVMAKLKTDEHLSAQDGKIRTKVADANSLDIRVSIVPITSGEKIVLRLLATTNKEFSLSELGMSEVDLAKVQEAYKRTNSMLLITGPTGSGKTTTIYSILKTLNTRTINIATIEDPVEYNIGGINQIQVNEKTNLTFAQGLRSILRQDPDIIFVGEIRDEETAKISINSAMTGHLVLSTLHTNDAATALPRFIDLGIEPFRVSSTVNVVVAQRLVRSICENCKVSYEITLSQLKKELLNTTNLKTSDKNLRVYKGKGCKLCGNSGYSGRIGVFEVLQITDEIRELINNKADASTIKQMAKKQGMTTMFEDGVKKVLSGKTTTEELLRVVSL